MIVLIALGSVAEAWERIGRGSGSPGLQPLIMLVLIVQVALAVRVQRACLLPLNAKAPTAVVYVRIILASLLLMLICLALFIAVGLPGLIGWQDARMLRGIGIAWTLMFLVCLHLFARWLLVLAAIAAEMPRPIRAGWSAGRGQSWRLVMGLLLASLPFDAAALMIDQISTYMATPGMRWPIGVGVVLAQTLAAIGTVITTAYAALALAWLRPSTRLPPAKPASALRAIP